MSQKLSSHLNIKTCITSDQVSASPYIPGSPNVFTKFIDAISETSWELWYFDGVSEEDQSAVVIGINRSAEGLKHGGFNVQVFALWANEDTWSRNLYFPESIVSTEENGDIIGIWKDESKGSSISFSVSSDTKMASLTFSVPGVVNGSMQLDAIPGDTGHDTDPKMGPAVHLTRPIGRASVKAELSLCPSDGGAPKEFTLGSSANGGMDRAWTELTWPQVMTESCYLRAQVGPYAMHLLRIFSDVASGNKPYTMARLYHQGKLVCAAQQVLTYDEHGFSQDSLILSKRYDTSSEEAVVTGAYRDKNTGYVVEFVAKEDKQRWIFQVDHKRILWNYPTSAPGPDGTGNTGFVESVIGGADEEAFHGVGIGGQVQLS